MRVLLYWYDQLSTILKVSHTECTHIHIDPCFSKWACRGNNRLCNVYFSHVTKYANVSLLKQDDDYFLKRIEEQCVVIQVFPLRYSCFLCEFKFSLLNDHYKIQEATMRRESHLFDFPRISKENKYYRSLLIKRNFTNKSFTVVIWLFDLRAVNWMEITVGKSEKVQKSAERFAYDYNMVSQRHIDVIFRKHYYQVVVLK